MRPVEAHEAEVGFNPEDNISVSEEDKVNGSPKLGDMVARNPKNHRDQWLVSAEYFADNLEPAVSTGKTLGNTDANGATKNVKDIIFWGDGDTFKLISKASSEGEGWMKSTKAMQAGDSVVVQVTTQQRNPDGSYSIAEALTTVDNAHIEEHLTEPQGECIGRKIIKGVL